MLSFDSEGFLCGISGSRCRACSVPIFADCAQAHTRNQSKRYDRLRLIRRRVIFDVNLDLQTGNIESFFHRGRLTSTSKLGAKTLSPVTNRMIHIIATERTLPPMKISLLLGLILTRKFETATGPLDEA